MANAGKHKKQSASLNQRKVQAKHAGEKRMKTVKGKNIKARLAELTAELNSQAMDLQAIYAVPPNSDAPQAEPIMSEAPVGDLADVLRGL